MNKRRALRPRGGMSLVELVAALAIVALAALMLVTAFGGAMGILRRGMDRQQGADSAYTALAVDGGTASPATAALEIGGRTYTIPGAVHEGQDDQSGVVFRLFIPGDRP